MDSGHRNTFDVSKAAVPSDPKKNYASEFSSDLTWEEDDQPVVE
jgi:hypothetical protein